MSLSAATSAVIVALIAALASVLTAFISRGREDQRRDAWHQQAEQLRNELRHAFEQNIAFLQGQLQARAEENRLLRDAINQHLRSERDE